MANYLTIDIGNSSAKAAVWNGDELVAPAIWGDLTDLDMTHLLAVAGETPECAAICSVAADVHGLEAFAKNASRRVITLSVRTPMPLDISSYASASLGTDRIAAMNGAMALFPNDKLLVVDCGTAVTYDLVSADGKFLGGNIAPGLGMRLRALNAFTQRLPETQTNVDAPLLGHNTTEAMQAGAYYGVVAEICYYHNLFPDARLVLTGGRAHEIRLPFEHTVDSDLVLRGLKHIIQYNEDL